MSMSFGFFRCHSPYANFSILATMSCHWANCFECLVVMRLLIPYTVDLVVITEYDLQNFDVN